METLYNGAGIHVVRERKTVLVIRGIKYYDLAVWGATTLLILLTATGFTALFVKFFSQAFQECLAGDLGALLGLGLLGTLMITTQLAAVLAVVLALQAGFPRRFVFDLDGQVCRLRHLPGLGRCIPLDRIESFDLVSGRSKGWYITWLCLTESGKRRYLRITEIGRRKQPENGIIDELRAVGEVLSRLVERPLRIHARGSPWQMSGF